jgi:hypothetical protein
VDATFPALHDIKSGLGVIRLRTTTTVGPLPAGRHTLALTQGHLPAISVYLVNALAPKDGAIRIAKQIRDALQKDYRLEFEVHPVPR